MKSFKVAPSSQLFYSKLFWLVATDLNHLFHVLQPSVISIGCQELVVQIDPLAALFYRYSSVLSSSCMRWTQTCDWLTSYNTSPIMETIKQIQIRKVSFVYYKFIIIITHYHKVSFRSSCLSLNFICLFAFSKQGWSIQS